MAFEEVTKSYVDDDGVEHEVTGQDIDIFPDPSDHDFYQEGSYLYCTCHPNTAKRMPQGQMLVMKGGKAAFQPIEVS